MDTQTLLYILAAVLIVVGLLGTILPALPGLPLVFGGMLLAAWNDGFERVQIWVLVILAVLTLLSFLVDFMATAMGAKKVGASRMAVAGAMIGMVAGLFMGLIGVFIAPFIGAAIGEMLHQRKLDRAGVGQAAKVGLGTWFGIVLGIVLKLGLAFTMLGIFIAAWYL
jgi:uncharacterized protein YqgC (DUF456 family)